MKRARLRIRPEASALGRRKAISPVLRQLITGLTNIRREKGLCRPIVAVEYGCGQLRNLGKLRRHYPRLYMIDTVLQLSKVHDFAGRRLTIPQYVEAHYRGDGVKVMSNREFAASNVKADVIFSINVMDVVPPATRFTMLRDIRKHLAPTGQFVSLVPRNDSRTLNLCGVARRYLDGHIFLNHGVFTYYKNWPGDQLAQVYRRSGLHVVMDLSRYRHSAVICDRVVRTGRRVIHDNAHPIQRLNCRNA